MGKVVRRAPLKIERLKRERAHKEIVLTIEAMPPTFYSVPYADPAPGSRNPSITKYPPLDRPDLNCEITIAFFTLDDSKTRYGNTLSTEFLTHVRDESAVEQFAERMQEAGRSVSAIIIDTPSIKLSDSNVPNFVNNTEGEIAADRTFSTCDLIEKYGPIVGRTWDIETDSTDYAGIARVIKACFLRGIERDPDHYLLTYTTFANRAIDQYILNSKIDPNGDAIDQALSKLGFENFTDLITKRGNLSRIETMSYTGTAEELLGEADTYALTYLAKGDAKQLYNMRKFMSVGVDSYQTDTEVAKTVAAACDPTKAEGFGRFMLWNGNCDSGLDMFESMVAARSNPLPEFLAQTQEEAAARVKIHLPIKKTSGNRYSFLASYERMKSNVIHATQPQSTVASKVEECEEESNDKSFCGELCDLVSRTFGCR